MGIFDKFMDIMGLGDEVEEELIEEKEGFSEDGTSNRKAPRSGKVIPINNIVNSKDSMRVVLVEPVNFNDCQIISDHLKAKRSVIINLEALELDIARRIIDFVGGTAYALDGSMQKAGGNIFVAVPSHVEITGDLLNISQPKEVIPWINQVNYDED